MASQPRTGTVVLRDGTYFLEAEGKQLPIPVSPHTQPAQLKELVGQKVDIFYSEPKSFVAGLVKAGTAGPRIVRILCYIPADPYVFGVVEEEARAGLARQFLNEGVLSKETFEKLGAGNL
jgi:hypothetical protein